MKRATDRSVINEFSLALMKEGDNARFLSKESQTHCRHFRLP